MRTVALGDYADVFNGKTPSKAEQRETGHPVLKIRDVDDAGQFRRKYDSFVDPDFVARFQNKSVKAGDTLILNAAHNADYVGSKTFFADSEVEGAIATGEWLIVRPHRSALDARFASHWLTGSTAKREIRELVKGIHLYPKDVARLSIPLPPLEEQKRIAAILDQADELRRKRQRALDRLNQLGQAIFIEMFGDPKWNPKGWNSEKLGDLCDVGSSKRVFVEEFVDSGVPFYRGTEVGKLGAGENIEPDLFIAPAHYDDLVSHSGKPEIGDLLLPSICHDGRIWKVDSPEPFYFKDGRVLWIKSHQAEIDSDYLRMYLQNRFLFDYASIASGTTFAELKIVNLKNLSVLFPPIDLQAEFSSSISAIEAMRPAYHRSQATVDLLFASLQHRAFRGEL